MHHTYNGCRSLQGDRLPRNFCGRSSAKVQQAHVIGVRGVNRGCCVAAHAGGAAAACRGACFRLPAPRIIVPGRQPFLLGILWK
jgi:hypothetical protein